MALIHSRCTTTTAIFTTKQSLTCCVRSAATVRQLSSRVLQPQEGSNSLSTGAAIALPRLNRWQRVCAVDCRWDYRASVFGATISAASNQLPAQMYTNAGRRLDYYHPTVA